MECAECAGSGICGPCDGGGLSEPFLYDNELIQPECGACFGDGTCATCSGHGLTENTNNDELTYL